MKLLCFDLGSNMALAHNACEGVVVVEHKLFDGPRAHRACATMRWLDFRLEQIGKQGITFDAAVYERPFARGMAATRSLWGIAGVVEAVCSQHGMAVLDATPGEIKMFAAQDGGADKGDMLSASRAFGYMGANEHEADVYCLLKYAERYVAKGERIEPKRKKK